MKANLWRLNELGFSAPAAAQPLEVPGQPEVAEACEEKSSGEFALEWKKPADVIVKFRLVALNDADKGLTSNTVEVEL